jgi:prepilin-type N-terminal cleavage/methylation domain-containing protein
MNTKGFTLIEMLVAVSIVAIAATGPLVAASRAYIVAQNARSQLVASYLSQEAIEFARTRRDNAYLAAYVGGDTSHAWDTFLSSVQSCAGAACTVDPAAASAPFTACGSGVLAACAPLKLATNGAVSVYTQSSAYPGAVVTPYTRTIRFYPVAPTGAAFTNATEVRATATTTWQSHGQTYTVAVSVNLTPWQ